MRGGISFVALLVVNPVIILFYQNCSMVPSHMAVANAGSKVSERAPASTTTHDRQKVESVGTCAGNGASCLEPMR